jgi:TetR/AcrR family transcriptional regulator, tetracycline repressor protein
MAASLTTLGHYVKSVSEGVLDRGNGNGGEIREPLTRDRICEAALEAIDEAGLESVSMRTLASALGVRASSLYYHFESKDDLMTGVAEYLYRTLGRPPSEGAWADQVKGTFVQLQDFIQMHPNAAPLLVRGLAYSPAAKKRANVLLRMICRGGLDPAASATLISNLVALLVGHSLLALWVEREAGSTDGDSSDDGRDPRTERVWVHRLFRADAPAPAATMELPGDTVFLAGLEALIKGFAPD